MRSSKHLKLIINPMYVYIYSLFLRCECPRGFTGPTCDHNVDDCKSVFCQNGGTCIDGAANYTCVCAPGYRGTYSSFAKFR